MMLQQYASSVLYVRTQSGIQQWSIKVSSETKGLFSDVATITKEFGLVGGKLISQDYTVTAGKNIGKVNETTPVTQAIKEAKREVTLKINEGYRSCEMLEITISNMTDLLHDLDLKLPTTRLDQKGSTKPMKAVPFVKGKFKYPAIIQPKINGVRANVKYTITQFGMFSEEPKYIIDSKEGHEYKIDHISNAFAKLLSNDTISSLALEKYPRIKPHDLVFDGEIYIAREKSPTIKGAATNKNNPLHKRTFFILFDLAVPYLRQIDRLEILATIFTRFRNELINDIYSSSEIVFLTSEIVNSDEEAKRKAGEYISMGFEGAILRDIDALYQFGARRSNMMKIKHQAERNFLLIDIIPEEKRPEQGIGVCENDDGSGNTFTCSINASFKERAYYLTNKHLYVGKRVRVGYFERTINNLPFHARILNLE